MSESSSKKSKKSSGVGAEAVAHSNDELNSKDVADQDEDEQSKKERKKQRKEEKRKRREAEEAKGEGADAVEESVDVEKEKKSKTRDEGSDEEKKSSKKAKVSETADDEDQKEPANDPQKDTGEFGDLSTFEAAKAVFPAASHKMFDSVTANFKAPTPIQARTWGATLAGKDVIGIAQTGSGKTLAFVLPVVARMMENPRKKKAPKGKAMPRALVLAPTRELCTQSFEVAQKACAFAGLTATVVYGGTSRSHQLKTLQASTGVDFLVATPGRLMDFMESEDVFFDQCEYVILDEADRMLDMGFEKDVRKILSAATLPNRRTLMFSATWPEAIRSIATEFLSKTAVRITLSGEKLTANARIEQRVEVMDPRDKDQRLLEILAENKNCRLIVFALYKKEAERVQQTLQRRGYKVAGVHGDKSQSDREAAVAAFAKGDVLILVATDVASRGLDIKGVELVINYTFPLTVEDYVHRIGRTGRAGASGRSITFFTEHDKARAGELQNVLKQAGAPVPDALAKFGGTVKKKEHALYGAHFKRDPELSNKTATMVSFDSDDE